MRNQIRANQTDLSFRFDTGPMTHGLVGRFRTFARRARQSEFSADQRINRRRTIFDPNPGDDPLGPMPEISAPWTEATADTIALYFADTTAYRRRNGNCSAGFVTTISIRNSDHAHATNSLRRTDDLVSWRGGARFSSRCRSEVFILVTGQHSCRRWKAIREFRSNLNIDPEESRMFEIGNEMGIVRKSTAAEFRHFPQ